MDDIVFVPGKFLSTLSLRRATETTPNRVSETQISIHALLAESDISVLWMVPNHPLFLSTLSLRRATNSLFTSVVSSADFYPRSPCGERLGHAVNLHSKTGKNFYPRSPCGERHAHDFPALYNILISIHALLAESDSRRFPAILGHVISIHALLAESDQQDKRRPHHEKGFLSTLSLRRATPRGQLPTTQPPNFYPRSPCGERLDKRCEFNGNNGISIHALLAESDSADYNCHNARPDFYPRSPCGERRAHRQRY